MQSVVWSALVVDANDGTIYINAAADCNMQAGMVLNVYRKGRVFTDPATGVVLDVDMQKIGMIRIDRVREKLSTAAVVNGETPARGGLAQVKLGWKSFQYRVRSAPLFTLQNEGHL